MLERSVFFVIPIAVYRGKNNITSKRALSHYLDLVFMNHNLESDLIPECSREPVDRTLDYFQ